MRNEAAEIVALAGVAVHVNLYYGPHLFIREGFETAALACDLEREEVLRLYERRGYQKPSYAMRKALR